jgi:hypothetical protein
MTLDLFPEAATPEATIPDQPFWRGTLVDNHGHPRVELRLLAAWQPAHGTYVCGWYAQVNRCVDEWHPAVPNRHKSWPEYPWHRTPELPGGRTLRVAQANALRQANHVLAQMAQHEAHDAPVAAEVHELVQQLALLTQQWLME